MKLTPRIRIGGVAALGIGLLTISAPAHAITYTVSTATSFAGCDDDVKLNETIPHTKKQGDMLDAMLQGAHFRKHRWVNSGVHASDYIEDAVPGGHDDTNTDDSELFSLGTHGSAPLFPTAVPLVFTQQFRAATCQKGTWTSARPTSPNMVFGEASGPSSTNPGHTRWAIFATCQSVDIMPWSQWANTLRFGGDMILGYRGNSADWGTTEEVLADFADVSMNGTSFIKAGWMWAIEDWYVDDVGSLIASGATDSEAQMRRELLFRLTPKRGATTHNHVAWAWHEG